MLEPLRLFRLVAILSCWTWLILILATPQAIAPFLITLRVVNRRALTSEAIVSGNIGSMQSKNQTESTSGDGTHSEVGNHMDAMETSAEAEEDHGVRAENIIDEIPLSTTHYYLWLHGRN